ncbi:MAG: leucine-rich repeat protein [Ruminococcus sp.]|nr:leucine-rich repeat protein [Ruminococcus sp.]
MKKFIAGTAAALMLFSPAADKPTIPSTVKKIGPYAFCYNCNLRSITIPEGVTELGEYSFY